MTKLNQESGRSMVEMLGVLAIIGVLSIGGIAGYTMAMNRYRANEVLSVAAQLAVLSQTANQGRGGVDMGLDDLSLTATNVPGLDSSTGSVTASTNNGTTTVTITGLSSADVGAAIKSIAGGNDCDGTSCTLKMDGGHLTVS